MKLKLISFCTRKLFLLATSAILAASFTTVTKAQTRPTGPCDILASATPCVAAYSTTRALYSAYTGSLYQVTRSSDNTTSNIGVNSNGYANAAAQDSFCAGTTCTITELYDQSSNHNHLTLAPPGGDGTGAGPGGYDLPVYANALPVTAGGQKVYGMYFQQGMGYRNNSTTGIAKNGQAEGVYMVTSGAHVNGGCCFDFGNAETNNDDNGAGHMDAINIICSGDPCTPVVGLDMENGIYGNLSAGNGTSFVTAMGTNDGQHNYDIFQGNAQSGSLTSIGSTTLPSGGYSPMKQEGAIILGMGGDNTITTIGSFFEGVMTSGAPSSTVLSSVQSNIVAVGYKGLLPYHDGFAGGSATGWTTYNGSWSESGGAYIDSSDDMGGDKAVTGSPAWDNYTMQGDVQVTNSGGNAGIIFRVTNPAAGADSLDGYFLGVDTGGFMILGRENYGWTGLQTANLPSGVSTGTWYHLTAQVVGCTFTVSAQPVGSTTVTGFTYTDSGCTMTTGAVGVRTYSSAAKWRNISVSGGASSTLPYYAPFASGSSPAGFSTYAGSWSLSSENYIDSTSDTQGDKALENNSFGNFTLTGDVESTTTGGNTGFLLRASSPAVGADSVDAYYAGFDSAGDIVIGRENYGFTLLALAPLNAAAGNTWYHLTVQVVGCQIRLTAQPVNSSTPANDVTVTDCSFSSGTAGVRAYNTSSDWRYLSVIPN